MSAAVTVGRLDWVKCALVGSLALPGTPDAGTAERRTWCGRTPPLREWCFADASRAALNSARGGCAILCLDCCVAIVRSLGRGLPDESAASSEMVTALVDTMGGQTAGSYELLRAFLIERFGYQGFCKLQEQAYAVKFEALTRAGVQS